MTKTGAVPQTADAVDSSKTILNMDEVWRYMLGLCALTEPGDPKFQEEILATVFDSKPYHKAFDNARMNELRTLLMLKGFTGVGYELTKKAEIPMREGVLTARHRMLAYSQLRRWLISVDEDPRRFLPDSLVEA